MSGHKRAIVQLGRQDLHRIEALNNQLRQVEQDYQEVRQSIEHNHMQQVASFNQELESRQQVFQSVLGSYDEEIYRLERQSGQALIDQADYFCHLLQVQEERLGKNTETFINQHFRSFQRLMQETQQSIWDHFDNLNSQLTELYNEQEGRQIIAESALQAAEGMLQSIQEVYDHELYFPGALERIAQDIEIATRNFQQGMFEACLVLAQQTTQQLSILRMDLEEIIQRTTLEQSFTVEKAYTIHNLILKNGFVPAVDLEGKLLETVIDVDFWTSGAYSRLLKRAEGLLVQLEKNPHNLQSEEFKRMQAFILPQMEDSLKDLVAEARTNVILSQIRYNIAEAIVDNLEEQGFALQQADYSETDERQPYSVSVKNLEGSQVKVFIESGSQPGQYCLQIDSEDAGYYNSAELKKRSNTLLHSLQTAGLRVGAPIEVQSEHSNLSASYSKSGPKQTQQYLSAYGD